MKKKYLRVQNPVTNEVWFRITPFGAAEKGAAADKGEQCVYCGKDSWTCEHFEESNRDAGGSLADYETDAERNA